MRVSTYNYMTSDVEKPSVTVVIPTWQRNDLLEATLEHIRKQSYPWYKIETIVVSDGPQKLANYGFDERFDCTVVELGRNWSGLDPDSFGIAPLLVGYLMAKTDFVMPWCDDERATTTGHIEQLVNAMLTPIGQIDNRLIYPAFVYPKVHIWRVSDPNNHENTVIGCDPPRHGQITHYMFKADNFVRFGYPDWGSHPVDWSLVDKWMTNGASWRFVPEVIFEHPMDR